MGELLDRLERTVKGTVQPMGFGIGAKREKIAPILLLGTVAAGNDAQVKLVGEAELDGAIVLGRESAKKTDIDKTVKALKKSVVGLWRDKAPAEELAGTDFQVFSSVDTPMGALGGDERTNVMQIEPELDDSLLRTIDYLPVDAFLVSLTDTTSLTLSQLMRLARVRGVTSRWIFVHLAVLPSKAELEELRELGVSAIVVDLASHDAAALKECREAMLELPHVPPDRKKSHNVATLPSVGLSRTARPSEPEPDEDDDWDDD